MRIDNALPYTNFDTNQTVGGRIAPGLNTPSINKPEQQPQNSNYYYPGVIVEISREAKDYNSLGKKINPEGTQKISEAQNIEGCQTCKNRKYVDGSGDPSVSYQSPQYISPEMAGAKVMSHEREHVSNEQEKARREDRKVISQYVSLSTAICPECGKLYISGGVTRTVTANDKKEETQAGNTGLVREPD